MKFGTNTGELVFTNENSGDVVIQSKIDTKDLVFKQYDGTETIRFKDSGHVEVKDNLYLKSDSSILSFGLDNDTTLTHLDGVGLILNGSNKLCLRDSSIHISSDTDGYMNIQADTGININIGGTDKLSVTNTTTTLNTNLIVKDDINIGTTTKTNAITMDQNGIVSIKTNTSSTTTTTGCLVLSGGLGVTENVNIGGDLIISGGLTVTGSSSNIQSSTIQVDDINIELGSSSNPTDNKAKSGGIILKGTTDKTI